MPIPLDIRSYGPILDMLGQGGRGGGGILIGIIFIFSVPVILILAHFIRTRIHRRRAQERAHTQLEKGTVRKDLDPIERGALMRLAGASDLQNPGVLLTSCDAFDHAVAARVGQLQQGPWLDMEQEVERLASLRRKLGFRYLAADRSPSSTRQLHSDHRLFMLSPTKGGYRLLSAPILHLDDLAIQTTLFESPAGKALHLKPQQELWAFFFGDDGREHRFRTRIYRERAHPSPHLLLSHGDALYHSEPPMFSVELNASCKAGLLAGQDARSSHPTPELFQERIDAVKPLPIEITELSGQGFAAVCEEELARRSLLLLRSSDGAASVLNDIVARVTDASGHTFRCSYVEIDDDRLATILKAVTSHLNEEIVQQRLRQRK